MNVSKRVDLTYLLNLTENNTSQLIECVNLFIECTSKEIEQMKKCCEDKNYKNVQASAHKLRSSIGAILSLEYRIALELIEDYSSSEKNFSLLLRLIKEFQNEALLAFQELEVAKDKLNTIK